MTRTVPAPRSAGAAPPPPRLLSVNVAREVVALPAQRRPSGIAKLPQAGPVLLTRGGLAGDRVVNTRHHGGPDQAVYAYAAEDLAAWARELGRDLPPGAFGENLTTAGLDVTGAVVGERWRVGGALLEVTQPRTPCVTFQRRLGLPGWVRRFAQRGWPGAYLRVLVEGEVRAGDAVHVQDRPAHGATVGEVARAGVPGAEPVDPDRLRPLLELPGTAPSLLRALEHLHR